MAEIILAPIGKEIVGKLTGLALEKLLKEIRLWWALKGELNRLLETMSTINAVLLDAEEKQKQDHQVKDWLRKLSEVMYDADDLLDDFATEASRRQQQQQQQQETCSCSTVVCHVASLCKRLFYELAMAHSVKDVRKRLDDIAADRQMLRLDPDRRLDEEGTDDDRETNSSPPSVVVGRDDDKEEVVGRLLSDDEDAYVLPIVGIGGLGKSTLAQLVFGDKQIKSRFEVRVWVYVSQDFSVKNLVRKILESVTNESIEKQEDGQLEMMKDRLRKTIRGRKYLIVLDDVWNEDNRKWRELETCLGLCPGTGNRVLLTTRSGAVAAAATARKPHFLRGISVDQSWELMVKMVFEGQEPISKEVVGIGKAIADKCGGVPLAVNTIGSLLRFKDPETEWSFFLENELCSIPEGEKYILTNLRLSYNHLPRHLKICFAYCRLFPKGYRIKVRTLIQLWIAQGFVESAGMNHEAEGMNYFQKLWWGSFFQEVERDQFGNVETCKMHDLMHDLATSITDDSIVVMDHIDGGKATVTPRTRHVSLSLLHADISNRRPFHDDQHFHQTPGRSAPCYLQEASRLRTFLFIHSDYITSITGWLDGELCQTLLHSLQRVRVLGLKETHPWVNDYSSLKAFNVLNSISELKQLRYIDFESACMTEIPASITTLVKLQVLNLCSCQWLERLPGDIEKLVNLRHLYLDGCDKLTHMPKGIGKLTSLLTLDLFIVASPSEFGGELSSFSSPCLSSLTIMGPHKMKQMPAFPSLDGFLCWGIDSFDTLLRSVDVAGYEGSASLPVPIHPLWKLKELELCYMDDFGGLPEEWLRNLASLETLRIHYCDGLRSLPPGMRQLKSLQRLEIEDCHYLEDRCWHGGGLDWPNICHIPSISILHCHMERLEELNW
ncbi:unnamed protein product [Linum tenue]|uniref:Disease resistance protein RGA3 n=1 Tax=Linum tenue TaxID=586396 RepID=A0AAV0R8A2_9ROSI|nr:unnamed protein product [Linum tenue]